MGESGGPNRSVKTAGTIFEILELLSENGNGTVTEVADWANIAPSTAHDHLVTLEDMGYLVKENGKYHLGLKFLKYGVEAKSRLNIVEVAGPIVKQLADETGEVVRLVTIEHDEVVVVNLEKGDRGVITGGKTGTRLPLHWTAGGKAILAELPENEVRRIVNERGLPSRRANSISSIDELLDEIEAIQEKGVAFDDEESIKGLRGVGCAINTEEDPLFAISIGAPANRLQGVRFREDIPEAVKGAVNEIELRIAYQ